MFPSLTVGQYAGMNTSKLSQFVQKTFINSFYACIMLHSCFTVWHIPVWQCNVAGIKNLKPALHLVQCNICSMPHPQRLRTIYIIYCIFAFRWTSYTRQTYIPHAFYIHGSVVLGIESVTVIIPDVDFPADLCPACWLPLSLLIPVSACDWLLCLSVFLKMLLFWCFAVSFSCNCREMKFVCVSSSVPASHGIYHGFRKCPKKSGKTVRRP